MHCFLICHQALENLPNVRHYRQEPQYLAQRNKGRCVSRIGAVVLRRRVPQPDVFLIIKPGNIVRSRRRIDYPLHKASFHPRLALVVGLLVRSAEPVRRMWPRRDDYPPRIHHFFRLLAKDAGVLREHRHIVGASSHCLLSSPQLHFGKRRMRASRISKPVLRDVLFRNRVIYLIHELFLVLLPLHVYEHDQSDSSCSLPEGHIRLQDGLRVGGVGRVPQNLSPPP
jgi:hypothetical protein